MSLKRFVSCVVCLSLGLGWATTTHAKTYALTGGGGQLAIGGGLPLPRQVFPPGVTGTVFPPLLIPPNQHRAIISGTTAMTTAQRITVPPAALSKPAVQNTVGLFAQNPRFYAVATNLGFQWPASTAVFSTKARTGPTTTLFVTPSGNRIRYSNSLGRKFGGPARFAISYGPPGGRIPGAPVTIYAIAVPPAGNPPCTHTALVPPFPGTYANPACVAALAGAWPPSQAVIGGPVGVFVSTSPLSTPSPGVGIGKFGANPLGTVSFFTFPPTGWPGFTDMASSFGYPWTTGMITVSAPNAAGPPPWTFTLTGMDNRTPGGAGSIQLVGGGLSQRATSGPSANRGWIRLELTPVSKVPTLSRAGLAAAAGLVLLAAAYAVRRKLAIRTARQAS